MDIDDKKLDGTCADIEKHGGTIFPVCLDVTDFAAVDAALSQVVSLHGRLDVAVNNAGIGGDVMTLADYSLESWERVMKINVSSVFFGMRCQLRHMASQGGGAIVNIASIMGTVAMPGIAPYVASKHAVVGLTKAAALEYGANGVRVNALCPSFVRTGFTAEALTGDDTWKALAGQHALRNTGSPDDIAATVAFLGSDDARFITGSLYLVDGGYTAA